MEERNLAASLAVGQALLDFVAAMAPELCGPADPDDDRVLADTDVRDAAVAGVEFVDVSLVFRCLLREERRLERELAECRYVRFAPVRNDFAIVADVHGDVRCILAAIIDDEERGRIAVELDPPLVLALIGGDTQRPLADRISVGAYLVRLGCQIIGLTGEPVRVLGDPVRFLRDAVRGLGELVRAARLEQGDHTGDTTQCSHGGDHEVHDSQ